MTTSITTGFYQLYGIVAATGELPSEVAADPTLRVLRRGAVSALVKGPLDRPPRASRAALMGHAGLLDRLAVTTPVLPVRFGAVFDGPDEVLEMLAIHEQDLHGALQVLHGRVQYTVKVQHIREAVLQEIVAQRPEVAQLRDLIADEAAGAGYYEQIRLGELVAEALAQTCEADANLVWEVLTPHAVAAVPRIVTSPDAPFGGAFLVENAHRGSFEAAAEELALQWQDRARIRLLGPSAAYDFVTSAPDPSTSGR